MTLMTSRERLLTALNRGRPDRLPVTTHHLMPWYLNTYLDGASEADFFHRFGMDPTRWAFDQAPDEAKGEYWSAQEERRGEGYGPEETRWIVSDDWRVEASVLPGETRATRYDLVTPGGTLSMVLKHGPHTDWVVERPLKRKADLEVFRRYAPWGHCHVEAIRSKAEEVSDWGILRGAVPGFQIHGQPGCWQDAVELFGLQELIMETMDDPVWVREILQTLEERKLHFIASTAGAPFDLLELGGGSASSTVISPGIFQEYVAPYDQTLIQALHAAGQRVVYHTCGGMMPLLELIADMGPDAMETFTPPALGGDTRLGEAKKRIGDRVCMIGGFDQHTFFQRCAQEDVRQAVRRAFQDAGEGGGYILAPSDHFFDAEPGLLEAFADEARNCRY